MKVRMSALMVMLGALALSPLLGVAQSSFRGGYSLQGVSPLIVGGYGDNFQYDGENVRLLKGYAELEVDVRSNDGQIIVEIETTEESGPLHIGRNVFLEGSIRLVMDEFFGSEPFMEGGIADNLAVHGDTGRMSTAMPELFSQVLGWGSLDIYHNGELLYENLEGHFMVTDRVRRGPEQGYTIMRSRDGVLYSPDLGVKTGFDYSPKRELHLWAGSSQFDSANLPQRDLFLHLNFVIGDRPDEVAGAGGFSSGGSDPEDPENPGKPPRPQGGPRGNNGVGNGEDDQPPGNPPVNDGAGSGAGNPGNKKGGK